MSAKPSSGAEALGEDIAHFIAESRTLLEAGEVLELAGLDKRVELLCRTVLQLSGEERARFAGQLQQLLGDLTVLGNDLVVRRDAIAQEIQSLPQHKKASVAYRVVDASVSDDGEPE